MKARLAALLALLLPELPLDPLQGGLEACLRHPLGTDALGRDGLLRLAHATARSLGLATAVALAALALALLLAAGRGRFAGARSALRALPALLVLLPLSALGPGTHWMGLAALLAALLALHLEPPLRSRLQVWREGPAWALDRMGGLGGWTRLRHWAPWLKDQAAALLPTAWIEALWGEATLRLLGFGPGPQHDSLGLLLQEELPRLGAGATPLAWASLAVVLGLALASNPRIPETP